MKQCFNRVFATILVVALIAPPIVLSMPQRVYAQQLNFGTGIPTGATGGGSLFGGAPAPLDGGTFGSVPTSGNNFGADPLHTNPGLGDVAPAGGAAAAPCTASLLAITAAVGVDIAGGLKVLGLVPARAVVPRTFQNQRAPASCLPCHLFSKALLLPPPLLLPPQKKP